MSLAGICFVFMIGSLVTRDRAPASLIVAALAVIVVLLATAATMRRDGHATPKRNRVYPTDELVRYAILACLPLAFWVYVAKGLLATEVHIASWVSVAVEALALSIAACPFVAAFMDDDLLDGLRRLWRRRGAEGLRFGRYAQATLIAGVAGYLMMESGNKHVIESIGYPRSARLASNSPFELLHVAGGLELLAGTGVLLLGVSMGVGLAVAECFVRAQVWKACAEGMSFVFRVVWQTLRDPMIRVDRALNTTLSLVLAGALSLGTGGWAAAPVPQWAAIAAIAGGALRFGIPVVVSRDFRRAVRDWSRLRTKLRDRVAVQAVVLGACMFLAAILIGSSEEHCVYFRNGVECHPAGTTGSTSTFLWLWGSGAILVALLVRVLHAALAWRAADVRTADDSRLVTP